LEISLAEFQEQYSRGTLSEVFSIVVSGEKRVYGKSVKGQANNPNRHIVVYAVVP